MVFDELTNVLFAIVGLITAGIVLAGGIVAFRAVRSGGVVLVIVGGALSLLHAMVWFGFTVGQVFGVWSWTSKGVTEMFSVMRFSGTLAWLLIAVGVLMSGFVLAGVGRQNQVLEEMMTGSRTDRLA